ncbi:MAG TPA: hypothetical protein PLV27_06645 [Anaerolineaceae bacterium]|nr:hypothetical protein [Anaerolineaceae bacterium]
MLNLKIAMLKLLFFKPLYLLLSILFASQQGASAILISSPEQGTVVSGIVEVYGSIPPENFASAKLSYAYLLDAEENWFLINRIDKPVDSGLLGSWDTTLISDGLYQLKLIVKTTNGEKFEYIVKDVQVANYSRAEAHAVQEGASVLTTGEGKNTGATSSNQPTDLPANPASIQEKEIRRSIYIGMGVSVIFTVLAAFYLHYQAYLRRR